MHRIIVVILAFHDLPTNEQSAATNFTQRMAQAERTRLSIGGQHQQMTEFSHVAN